MHPSLPEGIIRTPQGIHVLRDDSHLSRWVEEHGRLDIAEPQIAHYAKYIPVGGTGVDAGANIGDQTLTYAKLVGPGGRVIAFEPNPIACEALKLNFLAWTNVSIRNAGLSNDASRGRMQIEPNAGASFVVATSADGGDTRLEPLDWQADLLERCDFIHLDCEGFETRALLGGRRLLAKFRPVIVLEINHGCLARYGLAENDVLATLAELGYGWQEIEAGHGPHLPQRDVLALPL